MVFFYTSTLDRDSHFVESYGPPLGTDTSAGANQQEATPNSFFLKEGDQYQIPQKTRPTAP